MAGTGNIVRRQLRADQHQAQANWCCWKVATDWLSRKRKYNEERYGRKTKNTHT